MDTKTNRSEFVANGYLGQRRETPSWQKPAPSRKIVVKRTVLAYLKALFK